MSERNLSTAVVMAVVDKAADDIRAELSRLDAELSGLHVSTYGADPSWIGVPDLIAAHRQMDARYLAVASLMDDLERITGPMSDRDWQEFWSALGKERERCRTGA